MKKRFLVIIFSILFTLGLTTLAYAADAVHDQNDSATAFSDTAISAAEISGATKLKSGNVKLQYTSKQYTGKALKPKVTVSVKVGKKTVTLKQNTDYKVSYKNNTKVGKATVTVTGIKKYSGTVKKTFKITAVKITSGNVNVSSPLTYTGQALKPAPTVKAKVNGKTKTLKNGTDYTVSYKNNINAGNATVTVKGKGNFTGTVSKQFTIKPVSITSVSVSPASAEYTGNAIKPKVTVKAKVNKKTVTLKSSDYTPAYKNNINAGTATVTVTGKGNYTGSKSKNFTITPVALGSLELEYESAAYTGEALEPETTVTATVGGNVQELIKDQDYTVEYADNTEPGIAGVTVTGIGNFTGLLTDTFTIAIDPVSGWGVYDELIDAIRAETDTAKRTEMMYQAEDILMATNAVIPIYYYNDIYLQKDYVEDIYATLYGTKYLMYAKPQEGETWNTLNVNFGPDPENLDPAVNSAADAANYLVNAFSGLCSYGPDGNPCYDCAEDIAVSEDGLTYTVTLQEDLQWSDGTPLTASDFEYSWKRASGPELDADYRYMFSMFDGYDTDAGISVTALDEHTLQFVLNAPCAYMTDLLAFPTYFPVKQESLGGYYANYEGFVSNGAYICTEYIPSKYHEEIDGDEIIWILDEPGKMVFEKNPYFHNADAVLIERIEFLLCEDEDLAYKAYLDGDLDFTDVFPMGVEHPDIHSADIMGTYFVEFNVNSELFAGKTPEQAAAMREAMSILIDRFLIEEQTGCVAASTFVPVGMLDGNGGVFHESNEDGYYDPYGVHNDFDLYVARAIELLKEAGYRFDAEGRLSEETPLEFSYLINSSGNHYQIAEIIRDSLAAVGIEVEIESVPWNNKDGQIGFQQRTAQGDFTAARGGWIADFNDPINFLELFTSDSGNNGPHFGEGIEEPEFEG